MVRWRGQTVHRACFSGMGDCRSWGHTSFCILSSGKGVLRTLSANSTCSDKRRAVNGCRSACLQGMERLHLPSSVH